MAFCSHGAQIDEVRLRSILQRHSTLEVQDWFEKFGIATSDVPVRTPTFPGLGVLSRLCLPVRWHGVTYGYMWLLDEHAGIDEARVPAAAALAKRAGALMAQQARSRQELAFTVQDLLSTDPEAVGRAADTIHDLGIVGREVPVAALVLRQVAADKSHPVPMNLWRLPRSVLAASGDEHTTLPVPVGAAGLEMARDLARQAWDLYAERLPSAMRGDLAVGIYRLLACGPERALASAVIDPAVHLNVHRQTVYYRVQKIEQVTGLVLSRGDHRLVLHLGLVMAPFVTEPGQA